MANNVAFSLPILTIEGLTGHTGSVSLSVVTIGSYLVTSDNTYCMNLSNFSVTNYSNFLFNSMAKFNGKYIFCKSDGIYEIGGENDNGSDINWKFQTGYHDSYVDRKTRLRNSYLTFSSNGDIIVNLITEREHSQTKTLSNASIFPHERRFKIAKGLSGRFFSFSALSSNGSSLDLDNLKLLSEPYEISRR